MAMGVPEGIQQLPAISILGISQDKTSESLLVVWREEPVLWHRAGSFAWSRPSKGMSGGDSLGQHPEWGSGIIHSPCSFNRWILQAPGFPPGGW